PGDFDKQKNDQVTHHAGGNQRVQRITKEQNRRDLVPSSISQQEKRRGYYGDGSEQSQCVIAKVSHKSMFLSQMFEVLCRRGARQIEQRAQPHTTISKNRRLGGGVQVTMTQHTPTQTHQFMA